MMWGVCSHWYDEPLKLSRKRPQGNKFIVASEILFMEYQ
jgi:hypothetical protein